MKSREIIFSLFLCLAGLSVAFAAAPAAVRAPILESPLASLRSRISPSVPLPVEKLSMANKPKGQAPAESNQNDAQALGPAAAGSPEGGDPPSDGNNGLTPPRAKTPKTREEFISYLKSNRVADSIAAHLARYVVDYAVNKNFTEEEAVEAARLTFDGRADFGGDDAYNVPPPLFLDVLRDLRPGENATRDRVAHVTEHINLHVRHRLHEVANRRAHHDLGRQPYYDLTNTNWWFNNHVRLHAPSWDAFPSYPRILAMVEEFLRLHQETAGVLAQSFKVDAVTARMFLNRTLWPLRVEDWGTTVFLTALAHLARTGELAGLVPNEDDRANRLAQDHLLKWYPTTQ